MLDAVTALLEDPAVRAGQIRRIVVDMPADRLHIVDNRTIPDICLQHLVAMMIVDGGATFDSVHDFARMSDPKVLAIRKLVEAVPNQELVKAMPARQAIVKIETADGRTLSHRTYEVRGTPGNPMSAEEVAAKALDLTAPILGKARARGAQRTPSPISTRSARCSACAGWCRRRRLIFASRQQRIAPSPARRCGSLVWRIGYSRRSTGRSTIAA